MRDELETMHCFLRDADENKNKDERIRSWVSQIRAAAYDSEDIIETYLHEFQSQNPARFLTKMVHKVTKVGTLNKLGKEIESNR